MQTSKWINQNLFCRLSSEWFNYSNLLSWLCFSKPRRVEHQPAESEIIRENILIKRKLKPRLLRNRNKKLKKKTLLDVKSIECIEGDKTPIQRLHRNKTKLSGQTVQDESLAKTETQNINRELRVNIEETEDQQSYKESFINSEKVRFRFVYWSASCEGGLFLREMNTITTWEQINNLLCLHFPNGVSILSLQYRMFRSRRINETGSTTYIYIFLGSKSDWKPNL